MIVVGHSFVADCSLLDCCDFLIFFLPTLGFWGGFSCFVSFIWCQPFACLIKAAIFRLPPAYVVWSFVLCYRYLWSVLSFFSTVICVHSLSFTAFSAVGIRVRLFVFALLALVSWYQCISQFLVSCCALADRQLHPWRSELDFFPNRLPCRKPYKFRFEANPNWYSAIKFTKSRSAKCSLHKWAWRRRSISQLVWFCTNLTHFRLTARIDFAGTRA